MKFKKRFLKYAILFLTASTLLLSTKTFASQTPPISQPQQSCINLRSNKPIRLAGKDLIDRIETNIKKYGILKTFQDTMRILIKESLKNLKKSDPTLSGKSDDELFAFYCEKFILNLNSDDASKRKMSESEISKCIPNCDIVNSGGGYALGDDYIYHATEKHNPDKSILEDGKKLNVISEHCAAKITEYLTNYWRFGTIFPEKNAIELPLNKRKNLTTIILISPDKNLKYDKNVNSEKVLPLFYIDEVGTTTDKNGKLEYIYNEYPGATTYNEAIEYFKNKLTSAFIEVFDEFCEKAKKNLNNKDIETINLAKKTFKNHMSKDEVIKKHILVISTQTDSTFGTKYEDFTIMHPQNDTQSEKAAIAIFQILKHMLNPENKLVHINNKNSGYFENYDQNYNNLSDSEKKEYMKHLKKLSNEGLEFSDNKGIVEDLDAYGRRVPLVKKFANVLTAWLEYTDNLEVIERIGDKNTNDCYAQAFAIGILHFFKFNPQIANVAISLKKSVNTDNYMLRVSANVTGENLDKFPKGTIVFERVDLPESKFSKNLPLSKTPSENSNETIHNLDTGLIPLEQMGDAVYKGVDWENEKNNEFYLNVFLKDSEGNSQQIFSTISKFKIGTTKMKVKNLDSGTTKKLEYKGTPQITTNY